MGKTVKISQIIHKAADEHLWDGKKQNNLCQFSCGAIRCAANDLQIFFFISSWLRELGLDTSSSYEFLEFKYGPERQAVRYAWLKFCAMLAEEQEK